MSRWRSGSEVLKRTVRCRGGGVKSALDGDVGLRGRGEVERDGGGMGRRCWDGRLVGDEADDDGPLAVPPLGRPTPLVALIGIQMVHRG